MHRFRLPSRGAIAQRLPGRRLFVASCVVLSLGAGVLLATPRTPGPSASRTASSCKPRPPYDVELQAAGGSSWDLSVHNTSGPRRVVVWMWSESATTPGSVERRQVWAGTLQEQEFRRLTVAFTPTPDAVRVWASVESPGHSTSLDAPTQRGMAVAPGPAAVAARREKTGVLLEEPSGRRVEQYVGQGGLQ